MNANEKKRYDEAEISLDKTGIRLEGKWTPCGSNNPYEYDVSFLILDFNKENESTQLVESIRKHVKFDKYEVIFLSNGGRQDYAVNLYQEGLIDKLILYKKMLAQEAAHTTFMTRANLIMRFASKMTI